jgi:hypothetical protein
MQTGFSPGNRSTVKKSLSFLQESKKLTVILDRFCGSVRQLEVMTVRAAEITSAEKNRTGNSAGEVEKCHFL